jgi:hypothetical protein
MSEYVILNVLTGTFWNNGAWVKLRSDAQTFGSHLAASRVASELNNGVGLRVERK